MLDIFWVLIVPLALGLILTTLRAVASQTKITKDTSIDVTLDITLLALGASGGAFYNLRFQNLAGRYTTVFLTVYTLTFLAIIARLLYVRRFVEDITQAQARENISLAIYACCLDAVVIYLRT